MKKRILSCFLVAALLCSLLPQIAFPAQAASYSGSCGAALKWSLDTGTGALTITGSGEMEEFASNYAPWYNYRASIKTISLPDGLTYISPYAFEECTGVKEISFPSKLTKIGAFAFSGCTGLTKLNLPAGLTIILANAFSSCTGLKEVTLPSKMTILYDDVFSNCSGLTQIHFPAGLTEIRNRAFFGCSSLTKLSLPSKLTYLGMDVFKNCTKLTEVQLPDGLKQIESAAFLGCTALKSVSIPKSVTTIGGGAFGYNTSSSVNHQFIIYGYTGTIAQTYAKDNGLIFKALDSGSTPDPKPDPKPHPFVDVDEKASYYNAMLWALEKGITKGTDDTHFSPGKACKRSEVVTFLHRAKGTEPTTTTHNFVDVTNTKAFYYKAMLWAVEKKITVGTDPTHFSPDQVCKRSEVVTFLWRTMGKPKPESSTHPFTDVQAGTFYYTAMLWAVENGITVGTDPTHFSPDAPCTRAQVVTFLYRLLAK